MLGDIDLSLKPLRPELYICLPDERVIGELTEATNISHDIFLGKANELTFTIPFEVESRNKNSLVKNPNIDKLRERYLIKIKLGNATDLYVINQVSDKADETKSDKTVHAQSLCWELGDKLIRGYEDNVDAETALFDALYQTNWAPFYIDSDFRIKTRKFEVSEKTVLEFIFEIAETFGGIVQFDNNKRQISLVKEENIGVNKGLTLSYGKYLKTLTKESNSDEMVTQLHAFGSENLSIQRLNPTGATYIENFSYFMNPFEMDSSGNVISSSYYMSDGLCKALIAYQNKVASKTNEFNTLLSQLETQQILLYTKEAELATLTGELKQIEDKIYLNKGSDKDYSSLESQRVQKDAQVKSKQSEVDSISSIVLGYDTQVANLRASISIESNFTPAQIIERNKYVIEKPWHDDNFIDDQDLYDEAIKRFEEMKKPKTTFSIDIIDFLSIIEEQRNWDKLSLGDTVTINYEQLGTNITAKIIEIHHNYEDDSITLTISNTADILDEDTKVAKKIYDSYSTSTSLDMSKYRWNGAAVNYGEINEIINNDWDATKREIVAGVNNSISISGRGLVITSPDNPNNQLIGQAGVLALTQDGGNTWKTAIKPDRIVAEVVMGKLIAGVNLTIENESGKYKIDGNGFTVTKNDSTARISMNINDGFKIQQKSGSSWADKVYLSSDGNVVFAGNLSAAGGTFSGNLSAAGGTFSGNLSAAGGTFTGDLKAAGGTFSGNLSAAGGTFSGNLSAAGGTFSGDLSGASGTFSGTVRGANIIGGSIKSSDQSSTFTVNAGSVNLSTSTGSILSITPTSITGYNSAGSTLFGINERVAYSAALNTSNYNVYLGCKGEARIVDYYDTEIGRDGSSGSYTYRNLRCGTIISNGYEVATQRWVNDIGHVAEGSSPRFGTVYANSFSSTGSITGNSLTAERAYITGTGNVFLQTDAVDTYSNYAAYLYLRGSGGVKITRPFSTDTYNDLYAADVYSRGVKLTSSVTEKTNVKPYDIEMAYAMVKDLDIHSYHYQSSIDDGDYWNAQVGMLAEQLPPILKGSEYDKVNPYAQGSINWAALQKAIEIIESQGERISQLEEAIGYLG